MQPLRIGLLGYGTVGQAFVALLEQQTVLPATVEIALVSDMRRPRVGPPVRLTTDAKQIIDNPDVDLVVDVMGGRTPAYGWIRSALSLGKSVITANKEVMAYHGSELLQLAFQNGVQLRYEASVGGGIPLIDPLLSHFRWAPIDEVVGVLNGTTNYILSLMEMGKSFGEALAVAQSKGYAEADPSADIQGHDAVRKLTLILRMVFHFDVSPDHINCLGIDHVTTSDIERARSWGYRIKLIARAKRNGQALVWPCLIASGHRLANLTATQNGLGLRLWSEEFWLEGPGAGGKATALSVLSDVFRIMTQNPGTIEDYVLPHQTLTPLLSNWAVFPVDPDRNPIPEGPEFGSWNGKFFQTRPLPPQTVVEWVKAREGFKAYPMLGGE